MNKTGEQLKWLYAFVLIVLLFGWGILTKQNEGIITGFLITANTLIVQYYFRKKTPDEPPK